MWRQLTTPTTYIYMYIYIYIYLSIYLSIYLPLLSFFLSFSFFHLASPILVFLLEGLGRSFGSHFTFNLPFFFRQGWDFGGPDSLTAQNPVFFLRGFLFVCGCCLALVSFPCSYFSSLPFQISIFAFLSTTSFAKPKWCSLDFSLYIYI